ncbi:MAG: hypothetical protein RLZ98_3034 [Pseudomonadota bacterium]|jgi:hypothetical protein
MKAWLARATTIAALSAAVTATLTGPLSSPNTAVAAELQQAFKNHAGVGAGKVLDHSAWSALLRKYVKPGKDGLNRVDYSAFKSSGHSSLRSYIAMLERVRPAELDRKEQFAFWANLYNAKTIDIVLENYPVDSIRKISIGGGLFGALKSSVGAGGPWKAKVMTVAGHKLSLDDVEHEILRPIFKDPRVHYAVNCASIGCPNLRRQAFTGANLDAELDSGATEYVNHPRGITVADGRLKASSIYKWFVADFGGTAKGVIEHVRKYAKPNLQARLAGKTDITEYDYDWTLNDTRN